MQVGWVESIPGGPKGLGHVHTNRQYYPDMSVKSLVGNRASYYRLLKHQAIPHLPVGAKDTVSDYYGLLSN